MAFLISPQTPGPGTYKVIDPNIYKNRKPIFSMNARNYAPGDRTLKPGPGAHTPEMVTIRILTNNKYEIISCLLKLLTGKVKSIVNHCFDASSIILMTEVANADVKDKLLFMNRVWNGFHSNMDGLSF